MVVDTTYEVLGRLGNKLFTSDTKGEFAFYADRMEVL